MPVARGLQAKPVLRARKKVRLAYPPGWRPCPEPRRGPPTHRCQVFLHHFVNEVTVLLSVLRRYKALQHAPHNSDAQIAVHPINRLRRSMANRCPERPGEVTESRRRKVSSRREKHSSWDTRSDRPRWNGPMPCLFYSAPDHE